MIKFEAKKKIEELDKKNNRKRRALRKNAELIRLGLPRRDLNKSGSQK